MHAPSRRLAVIMVGDIVGFTAHMAIDERQALAFVGQMRRTVKPLVTAYDGQWVRDIGDGFLTSFDSAVEAVQCAVAIQHALRGDPAFQVRLGIHLGDVVFEDDDVLGDGVNVAARLEMLAVPGGICASGQIVDLVRNQPGLKVARLGVTNLPHQLEAYAVAAADQPLPTVAEALAGREDDARGKIELVDAAASIERDRLRHAVRRWQRATAAAGLAAALAAAGLLRLDVRWPGRTVERPRVLVADAGHDFAPAAASAALSDAVPAAPLLRTTLAAAGDDDVRLSARFNDLLRRTLAERGAATLVPDAEVRTLAARLRLAPDAALTPPLARQAAARDPTIRAVVAGDVRRVGARHMLAVDLAAPAGDADGRAWTDAAATDDDLLPAMQRLADAVAADLPAAVVSLPTPPPAAGGAALDVTTSDADALAAHGEALAAAQDGRWRDALERAEQAVARDPDFALARVVAAEAERRLGRTATVAVLEGADALTATLPSGEAALVNGAWRRLAGDCEGAARSLRAAAAEAPALAAAYADLELFDVALATACAGDATAAAAVLEAALTARPAAAAPAAALLRVELARGADIAAARRAARGLARRAPASDEPAARLFGAIELAVSGDRAGAAARLPSAAAEAGDGTLPIRTELFAALLAATAGDVAGAAEPTRRAADLAERQAATAWQAAALWQLGWLDRLRGDDAGWSRRLATLSATLPPPAAAAADAWRLADRARAGDARAPAAFDADVGPRLTDRRDRAAFRAYIAGQLALARGDAAAAARDFAAAAAAAPEPVLEPPSLGLRPNIARLAQAEAEAVAAPDAAMATLALVRERPVAAFADPLAVGATAWLQAHARLGRLYEAAGRPDAAVAAYEAALRWWGDSPLAEAAAVRARVAALTAEAR